MGGIGLWLNTTSTEHLTHIRTHIRTYIHTHTPAHIYICTCITIQHNNIRTQFAHNLHTHKHRTTICSTQNRTRHTENNAQPQHRCITYDLHKYSFDFYHEYIAIKNSNTIELYTISKENI